MSPSATSAPESIASQAPTPSEIAWPTAERAERFGLWLERIGTAFALRKSSLRLASADASFRRYLRVDDDRGDSFIIMDAPPHLEDSEAFVRIGKLMTAAGLRLPELHDWSVEDGFLLLEDLGSRSMIDELDPEQPSANRPFFQDALDQLVTLQLASRPGVLPDYDAALLLRELELFPNWYLGQHLGLDLDAGQRELLSESFALIVRQNLSGTAVYVHRDYMPRNLMLLPELKWKSRFRLGVLDFQDAVYGPISYDIASLMRDAFISWDEEVVLDMTVRYWQQARSAGLPVDRDFGDFYRSVEWMGLQRHLKVAGIFARLSLRDGKPRYLADTPRFINYIRSTASRYRDLKPLLRLLDRAEGRQGQEAYSFGRL